MLTTEKIRDLLQPEISWRVCYPTLADDIRYRLKHFELFFDEEAGHTTTAQLADTLWPRDERTEDDAKAIRRLYRALSVIAEHHCRDCVSQGPMVSRWGKDVVTLMWHRPVPTQTVEATPAALRSPEHAIVQRLAALDPDGLELDPGQMDELHKILADARKLAKVA